MGQPQITAAKDSFFLYSIDEDQMCLINHLPFSAPVGDAMRCGPNWSLPSSI